MRYSRDYRMNTENLGSWNRGTRPSYGADYYGSEPLNRGRSLGRTDLNRGGRMGYQGREIETIRARPVRRGYDAGYQSRDLGDRVRSGWNEMKQETREFFGRDRGERGSYTRGRGYDRW